MAPLLGVGVGVDEERDVRFFSVLAEQGDVMQPGVSASPSAPGVPSQETSFPVGGWAQTELSLILNIPFLYRTITRWPRDGNFSEYSAAHTTSGARHVAEPGETYMCQSEHDISISTRCESTS